MGAKSIELFQAIEHVTYNFTLSWKRKLFIGKYRVHADSLLYDIEQVEISDT